MKSATMHCIVQVSTHEGTSGLTISMDIIRNEIEFIFLQSKMHSWNNLSRTLFWVNHFKKMTVTRQGYARYLFETMATFLTQWIKKCQICEKIYIVARFDL